MVLVGLLDTYDSAEKYCRFSGGLHVLDDRR